MCVCRGDFYGEFAAACAASLLTSSRGATLATLKNTLHGKRERRKKEGEKKGREGMEGRREAGKKGGRGRKKKQTPFITGVKKKG